MPIDVLLVTVTRVETKAVLEVIGHATGRVPITEQIDGRIYYNLGVVNHASVYLAQSGMGAGGLGAAQQSVEKGIQALAPAAVIMVGIAFGVDPHKQSIGDVLVAKRLMLYDLQRAGTDLDGKLKLVPRGARPDVSHWLFHHVQSAHVHWEESVVRLGVVFSGEKLVDNVDFRHQLCQFEPEALGGEMEGAGLYAACQDRKVDWILVKAISDWADGHKDDRREEHQRLAAHNAARFVLHVLQHAPLKPTSAPVQSAHAVPPPADSPPVAAAHSTLPHQVYFFGRKKELRIIADALLPESRGWGVLIDGPGGIGKTALAIHAGHVAPEADFPIKIFLSAKARELTPAGEQPLQDFMLPNFMALLSELAVELGAKDTAGAPPNERANAVRRALTGRRALIIIDNLETFVEQESARLYQFLSRLPATCKAIVTSRGRSDIDARVLRLQELSAKEALRLVDELARSNPLLAHAGDDERRQLYKVAQGNPLLMRWIAGQLGRSGSRCRTVGEACEYLKSGLPGNDPLEFIFEDLLDTFTDNETAVLAALAHFTEPAKVDWIGTMAGLSQAAAEEALEHLRGRALLNSDEESRRFLLPEVTATFLRRKRPETIGETGQRLVHRAYALAMENGGENYDRFPRLESEWAALWASLPLLLQGDNTRLQHTVDALINFLHFSGRWDEWLWLSKQAEEKALAANDFQRAGWRALQTGWVHHLYRQPAEVLACAALCEEHWKKSRPVLTTRSLIVTSHGMGTMERAAASQLRGIGLRQLGDYAGAIAAFQKAISLDRTMEAESEYVAVDLNHLGEAEQLAGDHTAAGDHYREALRVARKIGHDESIAKSMCNLARLALDGGDWFSAEKLGREALKLSEALQSREAIGQANWVVAKAIARQGRPHEGLPFALRAVEIFVALPNPEHLEAAQAAMKECRQSAASA